MSNVSFSIHSGFSDVANVECAEYTSAVKIKGPVSSNHQSIKPCIN